MTTRDVLGLTPQRPRFQREFAESSDYILEPSWRGIRALVHLGAAPRARGYDGVEPAVPKDLLDAISAVADCDTGILDGIVVDGFTEEAELERVEGAEAFQRRQAARQVFVAVDLLEVDGVSLVDAPLLERKRHLAGVLRPSPNVRISPFVRRGMRAWKETLEAQGFRRFLVKKVNSRYRPGETNSDWLEIEKL